MKSRKLLGIILVIVLVPAFSNSSVFAYGTGGDYGIVNSDGVRLRTTPDTSISSNILGQLYTGERINITDWATGSGHTWAYGEVQTGANAGKWGYVAIDYLTLYQQ